MRGAFNAVLVSLGSYSNSATLATHIKDNRGSDRGCQVPESNIWFPPFRDSKAVLIKCSLVENR